MRAATILLAVPLACFMGCGEAPQEDPRIKSALQKIAVLEDQLQDFNERIDSCRKALRQVNGELTEADFHIDRVPEISKHVDNVRTRLASLEKQTSDARDLIEITARRGDRLVVRGIEVADAAGNTRCNVSPQGLTILDETGRQVCAIRFDETSRAVSASLQGQQQNLVTLYAGKDRAVIGAYKGKGDNIVGWAANVTPEGRVTAGKSGQ